MAGSETLRGLIALIASTGGRIDTRIRIQKEAFLLAAYKASNFSVSSFSYHHCSPYSREISDILQFAVSSNLLQERKENDAEDAIKYTYAITENGTAYLTEAGEPSDTETSLIKMMTDYHWRALELAATTKFLEMNNKNIDRGKALTEALGLKPETQPHEEQARELLGKLDREYLTQVA